MYDIFVEKNILKKSRTIIRFRAGESCAAPVAARAPSELELLAVAEMPDWSTAHWQAQHTVAGGNEETDKLSQCNPNLP